MFGEQGHPVRATISEMGPLLLSRLLDLNDTQEGVITIAFQYADDNDLLLAIATVAESGGGLAAVAESQVLAQMALPIAGILSDRPLAEVAVAYAALEDAAADYLRSEKEKVLSAVRIPNDLATGTARGIEGILVATASELFYREGVRAVGIQHRDDVERQR